MAAEEAAVVVMLLLKMTVMRILETSKPTQSKLTKDQAEDLLVVVVSREAVDPTEDVVAEVATKMQTTNLPGSLMKRLRLCTWMTINLRSLIKPKPTAENMSESLLDRMTTL